MHVIEYLPSFLTRKEITLFVNNLLLIVKKKTMMAFDPGARKEEEKKIRKCKGCFHYYEPFCAKIFDRNESDKMRPDEDCIFGYFEGDMVDADFYDNKEEE